MAKKKPKVVSSFSMSMLSITVTRNGETRQFAENWSRQVRADGTVIETGRPKGLPEGAGPGDAIAQALGFLESKKGNHDQ